MRIPTGNFRVVIAGGGVAALECALALSQLAPELTDVTLIAPNLEFVYRPMVVREPFAYGSASRYPLKAIVEDAGARLLEEQLSWIDPEKHTLHTETGKAIEYDALLLALGAHAHTRYEHAITIDDRRLDDTLHGLIQDIEADYIHSVAFVAPGQIAWPLPLYELALMSAGRAYDMGIELQATIVTPEDSPLAIFGAAASSAVAGLLTSAKIETVNSAYCRDTTPGGGGDQPRRPPCEGRPCDRAARTQRASRARYPTQRARLHPRRSPRSSAWRSGRLRGR